MQDLTYVGGTVRRLTYVHSYTSQMLQVGRYGQEYFDFSAERVASSVRESLARLQIPYIDIIQCHDIEFGSLDQVCCWCCLH